MIAKKNSRYDLERRRTALFQVGLLAAGSFTLAAFTYTSEIPSEFETNVVSHVNIDFQQEYEVEPEKEEPIVEQKQQQHTDNQSQDQTVGNSEAISENMSVTSNTSDEVDAGVTMPNLGTIEDAFVNIDEDSIEEFPLLDAQYVGGYKAMQEHVSTTLRYPEIDLMAGNQGKVFVSFVIEKDGSVSNIQIEGEGVTETIDREAKRVVSLFPKWIPGENAYGKVRTRARLPINFVSK